MNRKFALHQVLVTSVLLLWASNAFSQVAQWDWARSISTVSDEDINAIAVDKSNNDVYVAGEWSDDLSAVFSSGANPSTEFSNTYGLGDGFVAKYDSAGNVLWAFKVGGGFNDAANSIALDQDGNIYVSGFFGTGTNYFSGVSPHTGSSTLTNSSNDDFFIAKYNSDGEFIWVRRSESDGGDVAGRDLTTTSTSLYAVGNFVNRANFGPLTTDQNPNQEDLFLIKYNLEGDEQWLAEAGSSDDDNATRVIADETDVYFTGFFKGSTLDIFDGSGSYTGFLENTNSGNGDILLVSLDSNGNYNWGRKISSNNGERGRGICMDVDSLYLTGGINENATFPGYSDNPVSTSSNRDIFISSHAKSNGNTGWVVVPPCTDDGGQRGMCIDSDGKGNLFITGEFMQDLLFPDAVTISAAGGEEVFLASYTTNGVFRWAKRAGSTGDEEAKAVAAGKNGAIYIGGNYSDLFTAGSLSLPSDAGRNGYLAKMIEQAPIENDAPCEAILLPVGDTCNSAIYNNGGASDSGIPDPGCGTYAGGDVWFKAVIPPSGNLFIGTKVSEDDTYPPINGWMYRAEMAVYSGTCGSLSLEGCYSHTSGLNYRASSAFLFDNNPGDTIWIRVWEAFGNDFGTFSICTYDPGHYPAWDFPEELCAGNGIIDLDTTLTELRFGFVDNVIGSSGVQDIGNITGAQDGATARLLDNGDWMKLDLSDTIPAGEILMIYFRSNNSIFPPTAMTLLVSQDDITYYPHSFKPETDMDELTPHYLITEFPTRYLYIENDNAGGGGFAVDGIKYFYQGTRGGTWSGPGVTGSLFDPFGLSGPVSITYSVGGSATSTDSTRTVLISSSQGGILSSDTTVCAGSNNVSLDLTNFSGDIIKWESSRDDFSTASSLGTTASSYTVSDLTQTTAYRVIVQDGSCNQDTSNAVVVNVLENPLADAGSGSIVCGLSAGLQAIPSVGTGTWSAISGPGAVIFTPDENDPYPTISVDNYGSYEILWTEVNGVCFDTDTITIDFYEQPQSNPGSYEDVCGDIALLRAIPSAGTGAWSKTSGPGVAAFEPSASDPGVDVNVDQFGTYEFTWTEINGPCSDDSTFSIIFYEAPTVDPGSGGEICGLEFGLNAIPSVDSGFWSMTSGPGTAIFMPSDNVPDARVTVTEQGVYEFTWTEGVSVCSDQGTIRVEFFDLNEVDAGIGGNVCGLVFNLNAISVTGSGQWSKVSGPGNAVFSPSDTSMYVTVTADDYGDYVFQWYEAFDACIGRDTVAVRFQMLPVADAGPDQVLEFVFSTYLNARMPEIGIGHWEVVGGWGHFADESDPVSQVTDLEVGENEFSWIIQSNGCDYVSDNVIITVNDVYTPTVFTPNNDGQNDFLVFPGVEQLSGSELIVYNRWGTEVYRSSDYQNDWEGRDHKGRELIPDTYFYILKPGSERIIKGFVEIRK